MTALVKTVAMFLWTVGPIRGDRMPSGHTNSLNSCKTFLMKVLQQTNEVTMGSMVDTGVKPWVEGIAGDHHCVFQQDIALAHIANKMQALLEESTKEFWSQAQLTATPGSYSLSVRGREVDKPQTPSQH